MSTKGLGKVAILWPPGQKIQPGSPEYKLAILVTKQWSSIISVCSRLCVQIFCLKINSSWVRRLWGHQFYEFSSYSNIRRQCERSEVQNFGMFKQSVGLLIQDYVIPRHVNKYCTRYILRIQNSKVPFCVLYCFNLIQNVRIICLQKKSRNILMTQTSVRTISKENSGRSFCSTHFSRFWMQAPLMEWHISIWNSTWSTWFEASLVAVASHSVRYAGFHLLKIFLSGLVDELLPITPMGLSLVN